MIWEEITYRNESEGNNELSENILERIEKAGMLPPATKVYVEINGNFYQLYRNQWEPE